MNLFFVQSTLNVLHPHNPNTGSPKGAGARPGQVFLSPQQQSPTNKLTEVQKTIEVVHTEEDGTGLDKANGGQGYKDQLALTPSDTSTTEKNDEDEKSIVSVVEEKDEPELGTKDTNGPLQDASQSSVLGGAVSNSADTATSSVPTDQKV